VTFEDDKKGKMLDTGIIKVNDFFTLNDIALVDKLRYNLFLSLSLLMLIWRCFFVSLILMFLTFLVSVFVTSLVLVKSFKLIFLVLNFL
jgi:hypothetical protein